MSTDKIDKIDKTYLVAVKVKHSGVFVMFDTYKTNHYRITAKSKNQAEALALYNCSKDQSGASEFNILSIALDVESETHDTYAAGLSANMKFKTLPTAVQYTQRIFVCKEFEFSVPKKIAESEIKDIAIGKFKGFLYTDHLQRYVECEILDLTIDYLTKR